MASNPSQRRSSRILKGHDPAGPCMPQLPNPSIPLTENGKPKLPQPPVYSRSLHQKHGILTSKSTSRFFFPFFFSLNTYFSALSKTNLQIYDIHLLVSQPLGPSTQPSHTNLPEMGRTVGKSCRTTPGGEAMKEHFASLRATHPPQSDHSRTALLLVSRQIYTEGEPSLLHRMSAQDIWPPCANSEAFPASHRIDVPLPDLPFLVVLEVQGTPSQRAFTGGSKARLNEDVSKIFTRYKKDLAQWLRGAPYFFSPCEHHHKSRLKRGYLVHNGIEDSYPGHGDFGLFGLLQSPNILLMDTEFRGESAP